MNFKLFLTNFKINLKIFLSIILILIISIFLFFYPPKYLFSFEDKIEENLTSYSLQDLEKINNFLAEIDENKILDPDLKKNFLSFKNSLITEKELVLANSEVVEREFFPDYLDITDSLAKLHIQERNLSCESTVTTDILSTILGKDILEVDILEQMKKEETYGKASYIDADGNIIWGDPDNGFVGDMDGHQYNLTGYAIYEKPMSEIYKNYGVKFDTYNVFENSLGLNSPKEALTHMLKELNKGNFVQIRGDYCTDQNFEDGNIDRKITTEEALNGLSQKNYCYSFYSERRVTWFTKEGKRIDAAKQSHNFMLLGYVGDIENPEKIIVWDTQTGKHTYPTHEWMRKWELNDSRAIIVYNN